MVTEEVKPLEHVVNEFEPDEVIVGLSEIVQALSFLHDRVNINHLRQSGVTVILFPIVFSMLLLYYCYI